MISTLEQVAIELTLLVSDRLRGMATTNRTS